MSNVNKVDMIYMSSKQVSLRITKPAKSHVRPVWSESSLSAWRNLGPLTTHRAYSEDSAACMWHFVGFVMRRPKYQSTSWVFHCQFSIYYNKNSKDLKKFKNLKLSSNSNNVVLPHSNTPKRCRLNVNSVDPEEQSDLGLHCLPRPEGLDGVYWLAMALLLVISD